MKKKYYLIFMKLNVHKVNGIMANDCVSFKSIDTWMTIAGYEQFSILNLWYFILIYDNSGEILENHEIVHDHGHVNDRG